MDRPRHRLLSRITAATAAILLSGLAACVAPTPYAPAANGHGYSEKALEADRLRVTFSGNFATPRETVETYLLYRAAEITLQRGRDHFVVAERDTEKTTTYHTSYDSGGLYGFGFGPYFGFGYDNWWSGSPMAWGMRGRGHTPFGGYGEATTWTDNRYTAHADIVLGSGPKPDDAQAYNAREVIRRLGPEMTPRNPR